MITGLQTLPTLPNGFKTKYIAEHIPAGKRSVICRYGKESVFLFEEGISQVTYPDLFLIWYDQLGRYHLNIQHTCLLFGVKENSLHFARVPHVFGIFACLGPNRPNTDWLIQEYGLKTVFWNTSFSISPGTYTWTCGSPIDFSLFYDGTREVILKLAGSVGMEINEENNDL